jgi:MFS family permease
MQTGTRNWAVFNIGRVVAGLGVGLVSVMVPMYQSECSPKWIRGAVVSCYQWTICLGLLLAAIFSNAFQARESMSSWQIPIGVQFVWAAVLSFGMIFLPEVIDSRIANYPRTHQLIVAPLAHQEGSRSRSCKVSFSTCWFTHR